MNIVHPYILYFGYETAIDISLEFGRLSFYSIVPEIFIRKYQVFLLLYVDSEFCKRIKICQS